MANVPIELDCEEVWRHVSDYIDDEVEPELRASLTLHFKDCAHCSAVLDGARNVVKLIGDGRTFELPAKVSARLYDKLNKHLASQGRSGRRS